MATAENAKLQYEAGQDFTAMSALTDSGDNLIFTSGATLFSNKSGSAPVILPNGLLTGGTVSIAVSGSNDVIDVAALTCNLNGVVTSVSASLDEAVTRAATDVASISSVTVNASGAVVMVKGTDSADTTFSETRAAAGGPPLIPVDSIEIGQVRTTSNTAAAIVATEIFAVDGTHLETANFPVFDINYSDAQIEFNSALPQIHTGAISKAVHASYSDPIFADVSLASDFVPVETTHSVSSTQIYGSTLGASSSSLGQGSFTAYLTDATTDALVVQKNETLWFKFFADRNKTPNIIQLGKLGISRTFPAGDTVQAACTISAESESVERTS